MTGITLYVRITEDELTPLKAQLTELNANIDEQVNEIQTN